MKEQKVSYRYARALLESAKKERVLDKINNELLKVRDVFEGSRELQNLAASPIIQTLKKKKILRAIFEKADISTLSLEFLILLIEKSRGGIIIDITYKFEELYNIENNRLPITITSAVKLDDKRKEEILNKVSEWTDKKMIPEYRIDESVKGGVLIKIADMVYDATIKNQLDSLRKKLAG